jgi:hypothetical protein
MQFENETPFASAAVRAELMYRDLIQTIVVVKGTFVVAPGGGEARLAGEQIPVFLEDTETSEGMIETEVVPAKPGCDIAVLGAAHAPPGKPVESMLVSVRISDRLKRDLRVWGDRWWRFGLGSLRPSAPRPFEVMPLVYDLAYGGMAMHNADVSGPFFPNPVGRGYLVRVRDAAGTPLPNIEEPDHPTARWDDRPPVAGVAPLPRASSLRGERGVVVDTEQQTTKIGPEAFSWAHPRMTLRRYPAKEPVELRGFRPDGLPWRFRLPPFALALAVHLGARAHRLPIVPDTLYLMPSSDRVVVTGRCTFIYQFTPQRLRRMRIVAAPADDDGPLPLPPPPDGWVSTIARERAAATPQVPLRFDVSEELAFLPLAEWMARHPMGDLIDNLPLCTSG